MEPSGLRSRAVLFSFTSELASPGIHPREVHPASGIAVASQPRAPESRHEHSEESSRIGHHHMLPIDCHPRRFSRPRRFRVRVRFGCFAIRARQGSHRFGFATAGLPASLVADLGGRSPSICCKQRLVGRNGSTPSPVCVLPSKNPSFPQRSPITGVACLLAVASSLRSRFSPTSPDSARPRGFVPRRRPGSSSALLPEFSIPLLPWASVSPPRPTPGRPLDGSGRRAVTSISRWWTPSFRMTRRGTPTILTVGTGAFSWAPKSSRARALRWIPPSLALRSANASWCLDAVCPACSARCGSEDFGERPAWGFSTSKNVLTDVPKRSVSRSSRLVTVLVHYRSITSI